MPYILNEEQMVQDAAARSGKGLSQALLQNQQQQAAKQQLELKAELAAEQQQQEMEAAKRMQAELGGERNIRVGGTSIGGRDPLMDLLRQKELNTPKLTPGQTRAESEFGKTYQNYIAGGGKANIDQNINQIQGVQQDLQGGKRDTYDRVMGGALANSEGLMGFLAPAEKARRDRVRNAALSIVKQSVGGNPSLKEVESIFGQVYDPTAPDEQNIQKMADLMSKSRGMQGQLESAGQRFQKTGYGIMGADSQQPQTTPQQTGPSQPERTVVKTLRSPSTGKTKIIYSDGTEEIR